MLRLYRRYQVLADVAALMAALDLDMADWWQATPENYLSHVSKGRILAVVAEASSIDRAEAMRGLKKQELVCKANEELSGLRWLPGKTTIDSRKPSL